MTIPEILSLKYSPELLSGFKYGMFDENGSKFFGYSVVSLEAEQTACEFYNLDSYSQAHSNSNQKDYTIDNGDGTFYKKTLQELIEEQIFKSASIEFYGIFYEDEWFVKKNVMFFEEGDEHLVLEEVRSYRSRQTEWANYYCSLVPDYILTIDYDAAAATLSNELNRKIDPIADLEQILTHLKSLPREERPLKKESQLKIYREFIGIPFLVAIEKVELKRKMNLAYQSFINQEVFIPFAKRLQTEMRDEFNQILRLQFEGHFSLIYPQSKQQVIAIFEATNAEGYLVPHYFAFVPNTKNIFEWTLPQPKKIDNYNTYDIMGEIAKHSKKGIDFDLDDPSITLDDPDFWSEYVLKKKDGQYLYLKPVEVKNAQPDIYTQW